jgi:hypothetical protein
MKTLMAQSLWLFIAVLVISCHICTTEIQITPAL